MPARGLGLTACAIAVLLAGCELDELSGTARQEGSATLESPPGYRAELAPAIWALERVSSDRTWIWIRVAEGDCAEYHDARVREVEGGLRIRVRNKVLIPVRKDYGCLLYLRAARVRIDLPRALGSRERILGACKPGEETPERRTCALLEDAGD